MLPEFIEGSLESRCKFVGRPLPPVMEKNNRRLRADHMVVDRDYLKTVASKRLQDRRYLGRQHGDIACNRRVLVCTDKSRPGVQTHSRVDGCTHFLQAQVVAPQCDLVDGAGLLALVTHDLSNLRRVYIATLYPGSYTETPGFDSSEVHIATFFRAVETR